MNQAVVPDVSLHRITKMRRKIVQDAVLLSCVGHVVDDAVFEKMLECVHRHLNDTGETALRLSMAVLRGRMLDWQEWLRFIAHITGNEHRLKHNEAVEMRAEPLAPEWRLLQIAEAPVELPDGNVELRFRVEAGSRCPDTFSVTWKRARVDYFWDVLLGLTARTLERYLYADFNDFIGCQFWGLAVRGRKLVKFMTTERQQKEHKKKYNGSHV